MPVTTTAYQIQIQNLSTQNIHCPNIAALFNLLIDGALLVRNCSLRRGKRGLYVLYPARKLGEGQYAAYCEPKTAAQRLAIESAAVQAYETATQAEGGRS